MKEPVWINSLAKVSYSLFKNHDPESHLPVFGFGLYPLYSDLWIEKLFNLVAEFKNRGWSVQDYLEHFPNLSSNRFILLLSILHYKISGMKSPEKFRDIVEFLYSGITLRAKKDVCAECSNIGMNEDDLSALLKSNNIWTPSLTESKEVGKILSALATLVHGLYNDWCTDYSYEISGPYEAEGKLVLIRTFSNLHPSELWPDISWYFKQCSLITMYEDLSANIELVGCHITYSGNTVEKLQGYSLELDGKEIHGESELKKVREMIMPCAVEQYEKMSQMDFESQKIKYLEQEGYQLKNLFDQVDMDWKPSAEMIERVKGVTDLPSPFPDYQMSVPEYLENFGFNELRSIYS